MSMLGWRYAQNTPILFRAKDNIAQKPSFLSFLAITIAVRQTAVILILIPLQNEHVGMGICAKHTNFIQRGISVPAPVLCHSEPW